ncbi:MAG: alcohol dehydrogenase catalytic domain-containing protein [Planctomycetes bacterium]|nr:alcohol dehydrogenase catalytic domain-containing protein [Planctomycetota bacterium]
MVNSSLDAVEQRSMKALQFRKSIPRYVLLKLLGPRFRGLYTSGLVPVALRDLPEPKLPTSRWVRIAPTLAGICGSDIATVCAKGSPYLAPLTSMPFVLGHELVGVISETGAEVDRVSVGDRVVLHPALGCVARGIDPLCDSCKLGRDALCRNVTRGDVSSGIQIGFCRDTGGGFSDSLVAHESQVYKVPVEIDDRAAVLIEPFACALHGAFRACGSAEQTALVIGCGSIGLLTIAALRATGWTGRIVAVAKYDHQRRHAVRLGADETLNTGGSIETRYRSWAETLGAQVLDPQLGKPTVIGGADVTLDCVASPSSIDDGLRFTKSGGTFVLVGMPGMGSGIDWTPMWFKELTVHAAYAYGPERFGGSLRETFDIAMELMKTLGPRLSELVGPPFELKDYRAAFHSAIRTSQSGVVKTIFALENGRI